MKKINPIFIIFLTPLLIGLFMAFIVRGPIYGIIGLGLIIIGTTIFLIGFLLGVYK